MRDVMLKRTDLLAQVGKELGVERKEMFPQRGLDGHDLHGITHLLGIA